MIFSSFKIQLKMEQRLSSMLLKQKKIVEETDYKIKKSENDWATQYQHVREGKYFIKKNLIPFLLVAFFLLLNDYKLIYVCYLFIFS